jgi:hypothetical protein
VSYSDFSAQVGMLTLTVFPVSGQYASMSVSILKSPQQALDSGPFWQDWFVSLFKSPRNPSLLKGIVNEKTEGHMNANSRATKVALGKKSIILQVLSTNEGK